ncbi:Phosphatidate cytidylyltransferase [Caenorhabditis elegans]|uniref:Isoform a of Phosphatidate cytidylyltransferase n=1 Tax=Caenorhabditis elegans TaxID=6239 RepID=P53439-2|nr:Phosphatidate cytidylyltransferase [Caenorhabditis elegans]CCD66581.1 Phosphatidate cytidylyltransferase [Caenorhabditis elegans]|eukprot:NP_501297.1 Phosphatidate cytidylyltransferase [Caenorhabditis elegans]
MSDQPPAENADVRQRRAPESPVTERLRAPARDDARPTSDESDMEGILQDEDRLERLTQAIPQDKGSLGVFADSMLEALPPRWRNWVVRGLFSIIMISTFTFIVTRGATWLMFLVFLIQFKCFQEIISIGLAVYRLYDFPWFRALSWYFLLTSNYFFFGESLIDYWGIVLKKDNFLHFLVAYHRLVSFALYCIGFVSFVLSLRKGYYMRQFSLFAWTHLTLLLIVSQSFFIIQNIFQGLIWFLAPVAMIICCDIMSYMFGFFWGKTPLIKLSPKKTWEGFIGGAFSTVVFGILLSLALYNRPFFVCPVQHYQTDSSNCTIPLAFQLQDYPVPRPFSFVYKILRKEPIIQLCPFVFHSIALSLFASILGPFGGFFASGFKRAFKIKDFGDVIPGHGGLMDRFDCQLLMGTFVMVYIHSFIRVPDASKLLKQIMTLEPQDQLNIFNLLQSELSKTGLI